MKRRTTALLSMLLLICAAQPGPSPGAQKPSAAPAPSRKDSQGHLAEIVVGPFDLHRKYRSMEGPYVIQKLRVGDLIASRRVEIPESMVTFVEGKSESAPSMAGPSMSGDSAVNSSPGKPVGLVDTTKQKRELLWFTGIRIIVLDENDKPLPTAEFICHLNLDVDREARKKLFPTAEHTGNARLMTLTQGQTEFGLPEGFGVPVASDEVWKFTFQAANRTTTKHRRLKHLCALTFLKDSELKKPIKALHWYNPYIAVIIDKDSPEARELEHHGAPHCLGTPTGENAPNAVAGSDFKDRLGRQLSGHWLVPPGTHTWTTPISEEREAGFAAKDRRIHAVWSHVHPLCTRSSLVQCDGVTRKPVFTAKVTNDTSRGLEIERIEDIMSKDGILLPAGQNYELEATYENTTKENLDSMVALGIFCADEKFEKPEWPVTVTSGASCGAAVPQLVLGSGKEGVFCGIRNLESESGNTDTASKAPASASHSPGYPAFDSATDGPLLTEPKALEVETSEGKIHIVLDPSAAPKHATQMYKLFANGVLDGTPIYRYEPNFVLQTAIAETKADGKTPLSQQSRALLRRLPLEVTPAALHKKWALSMARYTETDSAVSSFSILLGDAPHLDQQYTVFGRIVPDEVTLQTIKRITDNWSNQHPFIIKAVPLAKTVASSTKD